MSNVHITDNRSEFLRSLPNAKARALEIIGGKAESYAKGLAPVDTGALRNSITHSVHDYILTVGSNIEYAPYVELGTGKDYSPPPGWIQNNAERGKGIGNYNRKPKPYLRPAIEEHKDEYQRIAESELKKG